MELEYIRSDTGSMTDSRFPSRKRGVGLEESRTEEGLPPAGDSAQLKNEAPSSLVRWELRSFSYALIYFLKVDVSIYVGVVPIAYIHKVRRLKYLIHYRLNVSLSTDDPLQFHFTKVFIF